MFSKADLDFQINAGNLIVQKHPTKDLYIYNYSKACIYNGNWNAITMNCRGLILDGEQNVIARPFKKFKNLDEHKPEDIPKNMSFQVFEKLDGSLGIIYFHEGEFAIASRGSFNSIYSQKATDILNKKYSHVKFNPEYTYCLEIIFPENRIVVDYQGMEEIILTAVIDTKTGKDMPLEDIGLPLVKRYDGIKDFMELKSLAENNREGFVVLFENGFRVKVKFEEYVRLHALMSRVSNKAIWELLKNGSSFDELIELVPDEIYDWIERTKKDLLAQFRAIEHEAFHEFRSMSNKKIFADYADKCKHKHLLLSMYNGRDYREQIWDKIEPKYKKGFNDVLITEEEI